jgi:hypothetical protein
LPGKFPIMFSNAGNTFSDHIGRQFAGGEDENEKYLN